ncbi:hypothetical protein HDU99_007412, partial [Rhizoclosmatium hyalinum]
MIQSILQTLNPYYSVNLSELERQTKANLLSRLTTLSDPHTFLLQKWTPGSAPTLNQTVATTYENEMKFAVERMYKQFLAAQFQKPEGISTMTCTDCAVQNTFWVENKVGFMILMGSVNGVAAVFVLISIWLSFVYKSVVYSGIKMIEIVQLEVKGDQNLNDEKAEFKVNLRG